MVGVLVFKKVGFIPTSIDEINSQNIEGLFNHINDEKLLKDIKKKLKLSEGEIKKATLLIPAKFEKFEKLWELLPELKRKYKLAVINNGNSIASKYWKELFDFSVFNLFINSAQEGIKKPDPKIFLLACKRLKVKPDECLFMDDSFENIQAAKKLGMQVIWWNKEENKTDILNKLISGYGIKRG